MEMYKCSVCRKSLEASETYEYRGAYACEEHFEEAQGKRDWERAEVMQEEQHKMKLLEGLSFGDSVVGRANRQIMRPQLEIARKESGRMSAYEHPPKETN